MNKTKTKITYFIIALIIALLFTQICCIQPPKAVASASYDNMTVTVIGKAEQEVAPDYAVINMRVQSVDMNAKVAKSTTKELFNKAVDILKDLGINDQDIIMTSSYSSPSYDYTCGKAFIGHSSTIYFNYEVDLENAQSSIDKLIENGFEDITSIQYNLRDSETVYNELLKEALNNAEQKAQDIVGNNNLQIIKISEKDNYFCPTLYISGSEALNDGAYVGKINISAQVEVKFALQ